MKRQSEIYLECTTCREAWRCPSKGEYHRRAGSAWASGRGSVSCSGYVADTFRGIEGVLACSSPRPSASGGGKGVSS